MQAKELPSAWERSCTASSLDSMRGTSLEGWATQVFSSRFPIGVLVWFRSHSREPFSLPSSLFLRTSSCLQIEINDAQTSVSYRMPPSPRSFDLSCKDYFLIFKDFMRHAWTFLQDECLPAPSKVFKEYGRRNAVFASDWSQAMLKARLWEAPAS